MSCLLLSSQLEDSWECADGAMVGDRHRRCVSAEKEWRKLDYNVKAMLLLPCALPACLYAQALVNAFRDITLFPMWSLMPNRREKGGGLRTGEQGTWAPLAGEKAGGDQWGGGREEQV